MKNPIKRLYKPSFASREVNLVIAENASEAFSANCIVTEFDGVEGWEQWSDSVFLRDFEDSIVTEPSPLIMEDWRINESPIEFYDPFLSVKYKSA